MSGFFDAGAELHAAQPDLILAQVWRAAMMFIVEPDDGREFVEGYKAARRRRDEFIAEGKVS